MLPRLRENDRWRAACWPFWVFRCDSDVPRRIGMHISSLRTPVHLLTRMQRHTHRRACKHAFFNYERHHKHTHTSNTNNRHTYTHKRTHTLTHNPPGALEGISYLVVVGFVLTSLRRKIKTGAGGPAGPSGLLGAVEGLSFASVLGGLVVLWLLVLDRGCVPNAQPLLDYSAYVTVCD